MWWRMWYERPATIRKPGTKNSRYTRQQCHTVLYCTWREKFEILKYTLGPPTKYGVTDSKTCARLKIYLVEKKIYKHSCIWIKNNERPEHYNLYVFYVLLQHGRQVLYNILLYLCTLNGMSIIKNEKKKTSKYFLALFYPPDRQLVTI